MPTSNKFFLFKSLQHFSTSSMGDDDAFTLQNTRLSVILVGFGSAALVITIYHCIAMGWCHQFRNNRGQTSQQPQHDHHHHHHFHHHQQQQRVYGHEMLEIVSSENSMAELIPAHKYQKGTGLVDDDGMCSVCLSQFEEGEELRTLPECLHSYHAQCIDMWLYSHSSCPMCRTDATPLPQISHLRSDSGFVRLDIDRYVA